MFDSDSITEVGESRLVGFHGDIDDVEASSAIRTWVHVLLLKPLSTSTHEIIILIDESDIDCRIGCDISAELEN